MDLLRHRYPQRLPHIAGRSLSQMAGKERRYVAQKVDSAHIVENDKESASIELRGCNEFEDRPYVVGLMQCVLLLVVT